MKEKILKLLIKARKEAGLTQSELGERMGVTKQHISNLERGTTSASVAYYERIFNELGYEVRLGIDRIQIN